MARFSRRSIRELATAHLDLQRIFREVVRLHDTTILQGVRTIEQQRDNVKRGVSRTLKSKHLGNQNGVSEAVDAAPYPIRWASVSQLLAELPAIAHGKLFDLLRWYYWAGRVMGVAQALGVRLRWGGDWDSDNELEDQTFFDLGHFEIDDD